MSQSRPDAIPSLVRWGLTPDADIVYRTLILYGAQTMSGLARELGLSRQRVERALCDLRDAKAARENAASGRGELRWHPTPAATLLARLSRRVNPRPPAARPPSLPVEVSAPAIAVLGPGLVHLTSRDAARQRLSQVVAVARHEQLSMNPESTFDVAALRAAGPVDRMLMSRGMQARVIGVQKHNPDLLFADEPRAAPRPAYREAVHVPMKLIIVDRKVAFFPVDPANFERGYMEISQQPVVDSLVSTYEQSWAQAQDPMKEVMPLFTLSIREQAVVALLSHGHTDAGAARELRISERSVSTIVRSIMDRLGVDNRFQLGVALGTLRVAPPPPSLNTLNTKETVKEQQQ